MNEKTTTKGEEENFVDEVLRMGDPFQKKGAVGRSPPSKATVTTVQGTANPESRKGNKEFKKLGEQIALLVSMVEDGSRRSIHQPMRDAIESIRVLYDKAANHQKQQEAKEGLKTDGHSQTSPWLKVKQPKRKQGEKGATPTPKRPRSSNGAGGNQGTPKSAVRAPVRKEQKERKDRDESRWQKVDRKKATKGPKKTERKEFKPRPDAIVIQEQGSLSFAEILRKVKKDPALAAVGEAISSIRRTQKGDLLLQLKETGENAVDFTNSIGEVLGQDAKVRTLTHRTTIECKDMDEVTTKDEICSAIKEQFGLEEFTESDIISLRKAYGGTQIAVVSLPAKTARTLLEKGKIKIGWCVCRLRERTTLTRCFKCLEFGHMAKQCKSNIDRGKLCRRCGKEGHIAKNCNVDPACMFCKEKHPERADHVAGSSKCPVFRRALSKKSR